MSIPTHKLDGETERDRIQSQRRWWTRLVVGTILFTILASISLCFRIYCGLQDPPEVAAIRGLHRRFALPATHDSWFLLEEWPTAIYYGIRGVSAKDLTAVDLGSRATDELVTYIAQHFPNVESVDLSFGAVTSEGLKALKACPRIERLYLSDTLVDDGVADLLPHLPQLDTLFVNGTKVSDAFAVAASRHEKLAYCDVELTDVTPAAVAAWRAVRPQSFQVKTAGGEYATTAVIRWADGEVTRRFAGDWKLVLDGSHQADPRNSWSEVDRKQSRPGAGLLVALLLSRRSDQFLSVQDGLYRFRLRLGDYDAEPAEFTITGGKPSVQRMEFRMPVTRAAAEKR